MIHSTDDDARYLLLLSADEYAFLKRSILAHPVDDDVGERITAKLLFPYKINPPRRRTWWRRALDLVGGAHGSQADGTREGRGQEEDGQDTDGQDTDGLDPGQEDTGEESGEEAEQEGGRSG